MTIYSPHVLILEGIFALHDERVLDMLDLKASVPGLSSPAMTLMIESRSFVKPRLISVYLDDVGTASRERPSSFADVRAS